MTKREAIDPFRGFTLQDQYWGWEMPKGIGYWLHTSVIVIQGSLWVRAKTKTNIQKNIRQQFGIGASAEYLVIGRIFAEYIAKDSSLFEPYFGCWSSL